LEGSIETASAVRTAPASAAITSNAESAAAPTPRTRRVLIVDAPSTLFDYRSVPTFFCSAA
jgi:hypothetical protein